jgi:hypothetical protein
MDRKQLGQQRLGEPVMAAFDGLVKAVDRQPWADFRREPVGYYFSKMLGGWFLRLADGALSDAQLAGAVRADVLVAGSGRPKRRSAASRSCSRSRGAGAGAAKGAEGDMAPALRADAGAKAGLSVLPITSRGKTEKSRNPARAASAGQALDRSG